MTDLLRQGSQWLESMRTTHCSSPVVYRRAGQPDRSVPATFGKTAYEATDEYGFTVDSQVLDFLIAADDLETEPDVGDVIFVDGQRYEVMNLGGEGCWRWSDPYKTTMRIHTKEIGN